MANEKRSYQEIKQELEAILELLQHEETDIDKAVELHKKGQQALKELEIYLGSVAKETKINLKIKKVK